jgi:hypothetical protein
MSELPKSNSQVHASSKATVISTKPGTPVTISTEKGGTIAVSAVLPATTISYTVGHMTTATQTATTRLATIDNIVSNSDLALTDTIVIKNGLRILPCG